MILVDTSVWIRFLSNQPHIGSGLADLLGRDEVVGHELIYGELLIGDRGGRREFLDAYELMQQARSIPHDEVVTFVRHRRLHGRGVGWVDIHLLASAVVERHYIWTVDPRFSLIAEELGVVYRSDV